MGKVSPDQLKLPFRFPCYWCGAFVPEGEKCPWEDLVKWRHRLEWLIQYYPPKEEEILCLPKGVRLCRFVPDFECAKCNLGPTDHTLGGRFPTKVCTKDVIKCGLVSPKEARGY